MPEILGRSGSRWCRIGRRRLDRTMVPAADELDHDEFGSIRSKFIVIYFKVLERDRQTSLGNLRKRDRAGRPVAIFSHPALVAIDGTNVQVMRERAQNLEALDTGLQSQSPAIQAVAQSS